jgi:signal transduction histidine kinase/DNA-binding NarL/FixJ family response regulator
MDSLEQRTLDDQTEQRYLALVGLGASLSLVTSWSQLAACAAGAFGGRVRGVRVWAGLADGYEDMGRHPPELELGSRHLRDLRRAAESAEPVVCDDGCVLVALQSVGRPLGLVELARDELVDVELATQAAPLIASRAAMLLAMGVGGRAASSNPGGDAEIGAAIGAFAAQAKQVLDHDRLSAYLIMPDGRAVERFAVATSETLPDEGIIVPFSEFGLRHILVSNTPLVSADLGSDQRIVGREDRVIAQAGFHGLLSVPLRLDGKPFGVLNFVSRTPGFYSRQDIAVAQQIADQAAVLFAVLRRHRSTRVWLTHSVAEHERARLARELHNTLARAMPQVGDEARALAPEVGRLDAALGARVGALAGRVDDIVADTRRALVNLVPPALDSRRLEEVIQYELDRLAETKDLQVTFRLKGETARLSAAVRRAVYRIVQEAVNNIRLHANASKLELSLSVGRDLTLRIEDDGAGFVPAEASRQLGLGLRFMAERARSLGGTVQIRSQPDDGTCVTCELPGVDGIAELSEIPPDPPQFGSAVGVRLRVYVIEPHPLLLAGTVQVLRQQADIRVVGAASDGSDAHAHIIRQRPDVVLLDIDQDPGAARSLLHEISLASPTTAVIATTATPSVAGEQFVEEGARGIASKRLSGPRFVEAITRVLEGGYNPGEAAGATPGLRVARLSEREREMLKLIASGRTNAEIADALFLARKTIERNLTTLVGKLGARNRAHAAALAVASGLVTPAAD